MSRLRIRKHSPNEEIVKQLASQIPWWHNIRILQKIKDGTQRKWYIRQTIENGWSRNELLHQIDTKLDERSGKASTRFRHTLPSPQSELAHQLIKDPYHFQFLGLGKEVEEREIEKALIAHIRDFLLELRVACTLARKWALSVLWRRGTFQLEAERRVCG